MDWEMRAASLILFLGILLATIRNGIAERRIVCYYTNWSVYRPGTAKFSPQNINPYLCTHLIYAFGGFTKDNALRPFDKYQDIEKGGYAKFTGLKTYNKNLKTMLAIGGWNEGSSRFSPMVADAARRREFVKNSVKFLRQNHFDGLDLDWEYPAFRDGGKPRDKDNYANLVQELREEFERESSKTGRPRLLLSMAMPAGIEYIDKGYDVPRLNDYLDFVNLLSYDYHSAYEPAVNHHSPLYPLEEDNEYNYDAELTIDYTISHLLEKGASADKIVLGIPTYGRSYTLFNQDATELGSPADGPGVEGEATREKGYLAYYEICESIAESDEWEVVQPNPNAMGPYAFKGDQWVGYDDEDIVKLKARYVNEKKLGGIMFWSIDNDDFRGKCHGRAYPLIEAAKEALLTETSRNTIDKTKSIDSRKKTRTQGTQNNSVARKLVSNGRRGSTTPAPATKKRVSSSRPKYRTVTRSRTSDEEHDDREVSRRSYEPPADEDAEARNTVRVTEKTERPRSRSRSKTRSGSTDQGSRRKQSRRRGQTKADEGGESLSNKLTTPEPPTTPDPGTDFKCEDEGFFPHPRDCKKYFWCLDSGPSGLGVVAHQFTCPSGLVFNKGADSCDYPRNVICPKSKTSVASTTRSPITAATSRTTYLYSTTTAKTEESQDEYDSEEDYDEDENEESEEEEVREEPKITTTAKPLVYRTLTRSRPTTTTTTTTTTTSRPTEPEKIINGEDEEDPKVIKELIDLIKKAGGIEQLERQLLFQERNSDTTAGSESVVTPATISRSLYERVLNRQANKINNQRPVFSSSETSYVNGPGRAQFEGLDDIPEVKSLRRSQKPQYVTIERPKSVTKEPTNEDIDENEEDDDNTEIAFAEEQSVANPLEAKSSTQRVTPNYVNIRRTRPSATTSRKENDVEGKEAETEEDKPIRRRRPSHSSKQQDNETSRPQNRGSAFRNSERGDDLENAEKDDSSTTAKSRYVSIQRFRSTTSKIFENSPSAVPASESTGETASPPRAGEYPEVTSTTASTTAVPSTTATPTTSTSTEVITVISVEPSENTSRVGATVDVAADPTVEPVKLVEDSATEILLTTVPASSTSQSTTTAASRTTVATVSLPRPFGFTRRRSGLLEATTTTTTTTSNPSSNNQARSKVADSKAIRLPTLKELIGYPTTYDRITTMPSVLLHLLRFDVDNHISQESVEESVGGTSESYPPVDFASDIEKTSAQSLEETTEEIGDSWLRQASESKAKSRAPKSRDTSVGDQGVSVTNAVQGDEGKRKESSTSIYLKPTTMRGIPLANLTPSPVVRGFYVTKSGYDLLTPTSADVFTSSETTAEQQTETTLSPDVSTTDEIVTVTRNYQNVSKPGAANADANALINDEDTDISEEKFSTLSTSAISAEDSGNVENLSDYMEPDIARNPANKFASKRGKSLRDDVDRSTTPSNTYILRSTTSARHAIALAVNRYNELTTPLWTGKRIVVRKRNRTTVSPIKDAIRLKVESGFTHAAASTSEDSLGAVPSVASSMSTSVTRKPPATPTIPSTPTLATKSTISPGALNVDGNLAASTAATFEDWKDHATTEATGTLTDDSIAAATHSIATIASTTDDRAIIATISNVDTATITTPVNTDFPATVTTSTVAVANAPAIVNYTVSANVVPTPRAIEADFANTTTAAYASTEVESTVVAATSNTRTTAAESVITITPAIASTRVEITPTIANYSAVTIPTTGDTREVVIEPVVTATFETANTEVETTSTIANYSSIAATGSTREVATEAATTAARETTSTELETTFTIEDYSEILSTIPTTGDTREVTVEPAITIRHETTDTAVETASTTVDYPTLDISTFANATETIPVAATVASTAYSSTTASVPSTADARVNATVSATTSDLAHADAVTTSAATTTTSAIVISPTSTDPNVIATPANVNIPRTVTSAVTETSATTTALKITSTIPPRILVTNTDTTLTTTSAPSTLTTKSFTTSVATPNILGINGDPEVLFGAATTQTARSIEIPTFETSHISLTSITTAIPSSFPSSSSATPTIETTSSTRTDETAVTSKSTQIPPTLLSIAIPITDTATVASETSTIPSTVSAIFRGSIATNSILRTTTNVDEPTSASTISETGSTVPESKTDTKGATSRATQIRARDQTSSRHDATNRQHGRRTSGRIAVHRRVVNRTDDWIERPSTRRPTGQYPRRRVTVNRGRPYRPPGYASSSRVVEENRRRRIVQKRLRAEAANSTARSDEKTDEVQNVTEGYDRAASAGGGTKVISKRVREKIGEEKGTDAFLAENTTLSVQSSNSTEDELPRAHREDRKMGGRRKLVSRRMKSQSNETFTTEKIDPSSERLPDSARSNARTGETPSKGEKARGRMRFILKSVKSKSEERNSTAEEANTNLNSTDKGLQSNLRIDRKLSDERNKRRRMRVVLKSIKPKAEERNSTIEETDSNDENLQGSSSSYLRVGNYLLNKENRRRRTRVVLKSIRPKYKEENSTTKEIGADPVSTDKTLQSSFPSNFRMAKNYSDGKNTRRRMKVVLKSVRPKPEKEDFSAEETGADTESKAEDLQGDFSSKLYVNDNLPDEDTMERRMIVVVKEISPKSKERETTTEETSESPASVDDSLRGDLSSNLHADDDLSGENRTMAPKSEEGQATTEQPIEYGAGLHATETSVRVEENTDRPSNEVNLSVRSSGESINRRLGIGHSDRQRKPTTHLTTASPLINTLSGTHSANRKSRPVAATLSPRMDLIDAFEGTESYSKLTGVEDDQGAELSDQSIRAQEFAVTLADPPSSSSDIGRTPLLEDAVRRKISTTVTPRTDPIATSRTVSRYGTDFRSRQRPRAKDKPTVNATVRPRRPAIVDYDYYEDEVPIVVGRSVLNSKLFLTSRGTIRCLDQGNFPHPYSCKKFITCARMVNGQVIGTEYTCPAKLSFDPVGGICNWSAGLGCKD